jgi:hypothetical protein
MHIHIARVRRNGKVYCYAQLVESYRREDGMPTQRVVARLDSLSELAIDNMRKSLQAATRGEHVVVSARPQAAKTSRPVQNLRYLDVAVLHETWRELGLDALIEELLPRGQADVAAADVVAALAIQRCVDPGSKLYAERWFPRTALPELLGVEPSQFNNTRLHRVLDELDDGTERLMERLPQLYQQQHGAFTSLFLDVTDTRFVGHGPELAEVAKTKEGIVERKVGIVLLCNQDGLPLRWQVVAGRQAETHTMHDVISAVAGLAWTRDTPLVMDRSMGASAELARMLGRGVRFVTALKTTEMDSYAPGLPHDALADLLCDEDDAAEQASSRVVAAGMEQATPTLYVLDGGVVTPDAPVENTPTQPDDDLARTAIVVSLRLREMVASGEAGSLASAARRAGLSRATSKRYRQLLQLAPELQQTVLDGQAVGLSVDRLARIAKLQDVEQQRRAFDQLVAAGPARTRNKRARKVDSPPSPPPPALRVRVAIAFNPERFVDQRRQASLALEQVQAHVAKLNAKLARASTRRTPRAVERELEEMLRRQSFLDLFTITVEECPADGSSRLQARLVLNDERWKRRRKFDGFFVIVAHPDVELAPADLCKLYRAKDAVEKDFQVIKSFVGLRPVWHRTDAKVRAHVTICMLALLLERALARKLRKMSAPMALELLATCCLNRFHDSLYVLTEPDADQRALLRQLHLERLADEADTTARLRPRANGRLPLRS